MTESKSGSSEFDVEKARSKADWFLEYPEEEDGRTKRLAMNMRAACNEIERLRADLVIARESLQLTLDERNQFDQWNRESRARLAEAEKLHKDFSQQHAECVYVAEKRAEVAEARLAEAEKERDNAQAAYEMCYRETALAANAIARAEAAEAKLAEVEKERDELDERIETLLFDRDQWLDDKKAAEAKLAEINRLAEEAKDGESSDHYNALRDIRAALAGGEGEKP